MKGVKSELEKHAASQKHQINDKSINSSGYISSLFANKSIEDPRLEVVKKMKYS